MKSTSQTKIAQYRKEQNLTQQQLADKAGLDIRQVQRFESGERSFTKASVATAQAMANALGVKIEDLI